MNFLRSLFVWLGAPLLASSLCTSGWALAGGGTMFAPRYAGANWQIMLPIGLMTLIFTIPGSTVLSGIFALMNARSTFYRYVFIVGFGIVGGGATMLVMGFPLFLILIGVIYGFATACLWIVLHGMVTGHKMASTK